MFSSWIIIAVVKVIALHNAQAIELTASHASHWTDTAISTVAYAFTLLGSVSFDSGLATVHLSASGVLIVVDVSFLFVS